MHPERLPGIVVPHRRPAEQNVQAFSEILRPPADLAVVREPTEREHGEVSAAIT